MKKFLLFVCLPALFAPIVAFAQDEDLEVIEEKWVYAGNDAKGTLNHEINPDGIFVGIETTTPGGGSCDVYLECEKRGAKLVCQPHEGSYSVNAKTVITFSQDGTAQVASAGKNAAAHEKAYCKKGGKMFGKYRKVN